MESNLQILRKSIDEMNRLINQLDEQADADLLRVLHEDKRKVLQAEAYYRWLDRLIDAMEDEEIYKLVPKKRLKKK